MALTSAAGLIGFLSEPEPELQTFALKQLESNVDVLWTGVAGAIGEMYGFKHVDESAS